MQNLVSQLGGPGGLLTILLPLVVGGLAIFLLLPRPRPYPSYLGGIAGGLALFLGASLLLRASGLSIDLVLFYAFSGLAILGGAMLVTQQHPARAALSFTLVVLSTSGLFLLLAAPFLMAATIIVYAGAIIVTFLFVIMLASQAGLSDADARSREPLLATLTGFLLLATILYVLRGYQPGTRIDHILARTDKALEQESRKDMLAIVEPTQTEQEKTQQDGQLFKQVIVLLESTGLRDLAQKARHAGDEWILADLGGDATEETLKQSRLSLEKLKELLTSNRAVIQERLTMARLPGSDAPEDMIPGARPTPLPLSAMSGPSPGVPAGEIRRDPKTMIPEMPAENTAYLGKSLFTDYLLPVELGGTLLLIATVGAIAIAQRRESNLASTESEQRGNVQ